MKNHGFSYVFLCFFAGLHGLGWQPCLGLRRDGRGPGPFAEGAQGRGGRFTMEKWQNCLVVWNINFIFPYIGNNNPN